MDDMLDDSMAELEDALTGSITAVLRADQSKLEDDDDDDDDDGDFVEDAKATSSPAEASANTAKEQPEPEPTEIVEDDVTYTPVRKTTAKPERAKKRKAEPTLFDVRFVRSDNDADAKRSFRSDRVIYINVEHPNFQARLRKQRNGRVVLGPRIAAYLANELAQYYQAGYYDRFRLAAPGKDRHRLYEELLDTATELENHLCQKLSAKLPAKTFGESNVPSTDDNKTK